MNINEGGMTINNRSLKDFLLKGSQDEMRLLTHLKPTETKKEVRHLTFMEVQNLKTWLSTGKMEDVLKAVGLVQDVSKEELIKIDIVTFFGILNALKRQLESIVQAEERGLSGGVTNVKWEAVNGSERMQKYGMYNTLDNLSGGDITKWEQIKNLRYSEVFLKLMMDKDKEILSKEMEAIKL